MDNAEYGGPDRSRLATKRERVRRVPTLPRRAAETSGRTMPEWMDLGAYMAYLDTEADRQRTPMPPREPAPERRAKRPTVNQIARYYGVPTPPGGNGFPRDEAAELRRRWIRDGGID